MTKPVAGFLLRSQVVSAFPGLEIKSYQASDGKNPSTPMEPLRIERLTNDVLLCLLPHVPAWIELNEPKESFGFGIEDDGKAGGKEIDLRNVKTTNSQPAPGSFNGLKQTVLFRSSSSTVLNVNALQTQIQQQMQGKLNNPDGIISPAEFAIQLIRAPEKMVFQNVQPSSSSL